MTPHVLGVRQRDGAAGTVLETLWTRLDAQGWIPRGDAPIVVAVGGAHRGPVVVATARSLLAFLGRHRPGVRVTVVDLGGGDDLGPSPRRDLRAEETFRVGGIAKRQSVVIPALWFESFSLVTIAGAGPDRACRLGGVLQAQAEILRALGNRATPAALAYEAHRLAASDLVIACGTVDRQRADGEGWWLAGCDDVEVERALGRAAGLDAAELPLVRALARHEVLPEAPAGVVGLPALRGYLAAALVSRPLGVWSDVGALFGRAVEDTGAVRRNLKRIPHAVRRRIAPRLRRWRAA